MLPFIKTVLTLGIPLLFEVLSTKWQERKERKEAEKASALRLEEMKIAQARAAAIGQADAAEAAANEGRAKRRAGRTASEK